MTASRREVGPPPQREPHHVARLEAAGGMVVLELHAQRVSADAGGPMSAAQRKRNQYDSVHALTPF